MYYRCQILINGLYYEATNDLKNWDDFDLSYKRNDYDGIVRSFSTKFEFVNRSYSIIAEEYRNNYLLSDAGVVFYKRNNSWNWEEVFRCALDFSTYSDDGNTISINAVDNTLSAIVKSKKNIQYEYLVSELSPQSLYYDGLLIKSNVEWTNTGNALSESSTTSFEVNKIDTNICAPFGVKTSEATINKHVLFGDLNYGIASPDNKDNFLIKAGSKDFTFHVKIDFEYEASFTQGVSAQESVVLKLVKTTDFVNFSLVKSFPYIYSDGFIDYAHAEFDDDIILKKGECLLLVAGAGSPVSNPDILVYVYNLKDFSINWYDRIDSVNIDIISPSTVASKLLESMTDGSKAYNILIDNKNFANLRLTTSYIMAAESARNLPNAKIYTSFSKFSEWMGAEFGYVTSIEDNTIKFTHRDSLFNSSISKIIEDNINDYKYSVNSSMIYSSVKVGYEKQDYDSINGRDEFRFTNEFSTGLRLTDNTLSLISPYRADAYGIEFLVQKRGEDTTDSDSDNDVFCVSCVSDGTKLILRRPYPISQLSGLISPDTMFNIEYSPRFMLEANKSYIGSCTNMLKFTSSDGNSDVIINGVKETDNFSIPDRVFTVGEIEVSTSDIETPSNLNGLISLEHNGENITGYIKQVKFNVGKAESAKYSLIVKNIKSG